MNTITDTELLIMISNGYKEVTQGKMSDEKIDEHLKSLASFTTKYKAECSIASAVFYAQVDVSVANQKNANGHAGGLFTPGGGISFGDLYTTDIDRLHRDTVSFAIIIVKPGPILPGYTGVTFYDAHSTILGDFRGVAIGTVQGVGGGTTTWK
jgi:hypothetical protein